MSSSPQGAPGIRFGSNALEVMQEPSAPEITPQSLLGAQQPSITMPPVPPSIGAMPMPKPAVIRSGQSGSG